MRVEIWSDIMCPFCYLGKRRFDRALRESGHAGDADIELKSFQLDPTLPGTSTMSSEEYLAGTKGIDPKVARRMNERVASAGAEEGLAYDFDRVLVVNTFDAHRLLHVAKEYGRQMETADRLFRAHFEEGLNVADRLVLTEVGVQAGLHRDAVSMALTSGAYADGVRADIDEARELGISGVPFFVFDRRYAVSGAQDVAVFHDVIRRVLEEP